jgi:hypothetical protein
MFPRVVGIVSVLAQVRIVLRTRPPGRVQTVVAFVWLEAAFRGMHADDRVGRDAEHLHAFEIGRHVRLADQHIAHVDLLQMVAQCRLADAQRPAVPVRAMRAHVAAGVEAHARGTADRR